MRKFRILLFEVIGFAMLVGWLMWKYPELVDDIIPWVALLIAWHVTWEYILDTETVRRYGVLLGKRPRPMIAWPLVFILGGLISLAYWQGINKALGGGSTGLAFVVPGRSWCELFLWKTRASHEERKK